MNTFEISRKLVGEKGLGDNYKNFEHVVFKVRNYYIKYLGKRLMNFIELYIDNGTRNTGHTPTITPVFGKYLIIKLGITHRCSEARIAFQFAHELMHFVYFVKYGVNRKRVTEQEEAICSAAALIVLHDLYPGEEFEKYNDYTQSLLNPDYRSGAEVAKSVNYKFKKIIQKI